MPPIGNTLLLQFQSSLPDIAIVRNSFHVRRNETAGNVDEQFLIDLLGSAGTIDLQGRYRELLSVRMRFDGIFVRQVRDPLNPTDPKLEHFRAVNQMGLRLTPDPGIPNEICAIAALHTDTASRRFRGHVFLPPCIGDGELAGSHFNTNGDYVPAIADFLQALGKTMEPAGAAHYDGAWNDTDLVVYSARARALDADQFYAQVQSATSNGKVHWLRSRGPEI